MHSVVLGSSCSCCGLSGRPFQAVTLGDSPMREYVMTRVHLCSRKVQGLRADTINSGHDNTNGNVCVYEKMCLHGL